MINLGCFRSGTTFVLIHGGFHGGWCWQGVSHRLQALGHRVYSPTLTGLGDRSHQLTTETSLDSFEEDIRQLFYFEDITNAVVVGHSFGGSLVSLAADRMPERIKHLVYLDAMILEDGQCPADTCPPGHIDRYAEIAVDTGNGEVIPVGKPEHFGIKDKETATWVAERLTPQPLRTFQDVLHLNNPVGNGLPTTYIACSQPFWSSTANSRELARRTNGWNFREISCGHDAMILLPDELADMLSELS